MDRLKTLPKFTPIFLSLFLAVACGEGGIESKIIRTDPTLAEVNGGSEPSGNTNLPPNATDGPDEPGTDPDNTQEEPKPKPSKKPKGKNNTPCGPIQEMPGHDPMWTYYNCGPFEGMWVQQGTPDAFSGEILGPRRVGRGMVSVKYTGLTNTAFAYKETFGLFFSADGNHGLPVNWQWMSYAAGGGYIESRLIIQRFDKTCQPFCEEHFKVQSLQFEDPNDTYQWDCRWNEDDMMIYCDITKVGDPNFLIETWNYMKGPYNSLQYMGVGRKAFDGGYPNYQCTVTDFKLTFFR